MGITVSKGSDVDIQSPHASDQADAKNEQTSFPLLKLPPEIRNRIYILVVGQPSPITLCSTSGDVDLVFHSKGHVKSWKPSSRRRSSPYEPPDWKNLPLRAQPAITRVSRQLRAESLPLFYSINTFTDHSLRDFDSEWLELQGHSTFRCDPSHHQHCFTAPFIYLFSWLVSIGPANCAMLRDIPIHICNPESIPEIDLDIAWFFMIFFLCPNPLPSCVLDAVRPVSCPTCADLGYAGPDFAGISSTGFYDPDSNGAYPSDDDCDDPGKPEGTLTTQILIDATKEAIRRQREGLRGCDRLGMCRWFFVKVCSTLHHRYHRELSLLEADQHARTAFESRKAYFELDEPVLRSCRHLDEWHKWWNRVVKTRKAPKTVTHCTVS